MNKVLDMAKSLIYKHLPKRAELLVEKTPGKTPLVVMLGKKYPDAQFIITGVLSTNSNSHGPNGFLYIPYAKELTCRVWSIIKEFN